jgi:hypothetical protein
VSARLARLLANFVGLADVTVAFRLMFVRTSGRLTADEADFVPEPQRRKVYRTAYTSRSADAPSGPAAQASRGHPRLRSTINGAWSLGPWPLRASRSTQASVTERARAALA